MKTISAFRKGQTVLRCIWYFKVDDNFCLCWTNDQSYLSYREDSWMTEDVPEDWNKTKCSASLVGGQEELGIYSVILIPRTSTDSDKIL